MRFESKRKNGVHYFMNRSPRVGSAWPGAKLRLNAPNPGPDVNPVGPRTHARKYRLNRAPAWGWVVIGRSGIGYKDGSFIKGKSLSAANPRNIGEKTEVHGQVSLKNGADLQSYHIASKVITNFYQSLSKTGITIYAILDLHVSFISMMCERTFYQHFKNIFVK